MSLNPETSFVGKIAPSDANYPYGSARDITTPGDATGTPWKALLVNDIFGFQQAMLNYANIVPSNSPDTILASQYLESLQQLVAGSTYLVDSGAANAYLASVVANAPVIRSLITGATYRFTPANDNTGASTVDVQGLGAKTIKRSDGSAVQAGDILAGILLEMDYNGTDFLLRTISVGGAGLFNQANINQALININKQTGTTYTLTLSDRGGMVSLDNAAAITLTVPLDASVSYPEGTVIAGVQFGAGQVTIAPAGGVTIIDDSGLKTIAQGSQFTLTKHDSADTWILTGGLEV